jgi:hypothetical protein
MVAHYSGLVTAVRDTSSDVSVSAHCMRFVGCFERPDLFRRQFDIERSYSALEMFYFGRSNYGCGDARLLKQPCQRDL